MKKLLVSIAVMALCFTVCNAQKVKNESAEQVALMFMNALIDLDYDIINEYAAEELLDEATMEELTTNKDVNELRNANKRYVLKIFKVELFNTDNKNDQFNQPFDADEASKALVWMGQYSRSGRSTASGSGRVSLTKEDSIWKVEGFNF